MKRKSTSNNVVNAATSSEGAAANKRTAAPTTTPSPWPLYSLVSTLAVACYLNGLKGGFVHDDIPAIIQNKDVLALQPIGHVFRDDFWGTPMSDRSSHKSYRPLTVLTFRMNYMVFGLQPFWFHATNVVLHAFVCILFTRVCLSVAAMKPPLATLAGLLFAIHPIHTEAVTGIVGRADVLACAFFLLSLLAYHGHPEGRCYIWTSVTLGTLSMLAKETGIMVFLLNLLYDFYRQWPSIRKTILEARWNPATHDFATRAAKILTSLGILLAVRLALLQGSLPRFSQQDNPAAFHPSLYVRTLTFCYLAAFNWWLLLCPATLSHDWQMGSIPLITSVTDSRNLVTCCCFGAIALLALKTLNDFENHKHVPLVLAVLLLVLPFLPATNLFVTVGFVVAERILYMPSMGQILLVVYGIQILWNTKVQQRQTIICCLFLLVATGCFRTVIRNRDWRSRESLLRAGLETIPHNAKMHYNYANFLRESALQEAAKFHYNKALRLWPMYASAHNNLGTILTNEKEAEQHFLAAIRYSPEHVNAHYNLGQLYRKSNRTLDSERMLQTCINLDPHFSAAYIELARLYGAKSRKIAFLLKTVINLNGADPYYSTIYGHWLSGKNNRLAAIEYYWQSLASSISYTPAMIGIARILRQNGQYSRLLQLITRWYSIQRMKNGGAGAPFLSSNFYLQEWQLKVEMRSKARAYDKCSTTLICGKCCVEILSRIRDDSNKTATPGDPAGATNSRNLQKRVKIKQNSTTKIVSVKEKCKAQQEKLVGQQQESTAPILMQQFFD